MSGSAKFDAFKFFDKSMTVHSGINAHVISSFALTGPEIKPCKLPDIVEHLPFIHVGFCSNPCNKFETIIVYFK